MDNGFLSRQKRNFSEPSAAGNEEEYVVQHASGQAELEQAGDKQHVGEHVQQAENVQHASGQVEHLQHASGQAENVQHASGQAENAQHASGQAEHLQHASGQAEFVQHASGQAEFVQAENVQHASGQAEFVQHASGQTENGQLESNQMENSHDGGAIEQPVGPAVTTTGTGQNALKASQDLAATSAEDGKKALPEFTLQKETNTKVISSLLSFVSYGKSLEFHAYIVKSVNCSDRYAVPL